MIKTDEVLKETTLNELKKQCSDLIASRCIEVNLSMKKPQEGSVQRLDEQPHTKAGKGKGIKDRASQNLQFAKELNREMELMFADDDF